jgi:hypothetical protein
LSERRDEAIAAAGHIDDITGRLAGIAERLAQRCDMEAQAALVDIDVGPDALDQLSLVDDFTGAPGQEDEDIERAAADMKRRALLLQEPGLRKQSKWPKGNGRVFGTIWHAPLPPQRESKCITFWVYQNEAYSKLAESSGQSW